MSATRVALMWPWLPAYQVRLCELSRERLAKSDIDLHVVTGTPPPDRTSRGDARDAEWCTVVPTTWWQVRGKWLPCRRIGPFMRSYNPDLFIVEQAVKNVEVAPYLVHSHGHPRVGFWGHGRSYSTPQGPTVARVKSALTRRGDWFFAYTSRGASHVIEQGFPATRVTVLNNTVDTHHLKRDLDAVTDEDVARFLQTHGLQAGRTALFIGGVDEHKGIEFLLDAANFVGGALPGFRLIVGGDGSQRPLVEAAEAQGAPVRYLGRLDGAAKAVALCACDVLAIPEAIGLVAVDSLVAGRPIISTTHPCHGPERDYLADGVTALFSTHTVSAYADALIATLVTPGRSAAMGRACEQAAPDYSLESMVDSFCQGVEAWDDVRRAGL